MGIEMICANISCSNLEASLPWYGKLFGTPPTRRPMDGLAEWQFTSSAVVQLYQDSDKAGRSTLTIGVVSLQREQDRLAAEGIETGPIEPAKNSSIMRIQDPDGNLIVMADAKQRTPATG